MSIDPAISATRSVLTPAIVAIAVVFATFLAWQAVDTPSRAGGGDRVAQPAVQPIQGTGDSVGYGDPIAMP